MSLEGNIDTKVLKGKIVDFPNFPMIDDTLTTEGACADAKAAGDADNLLDVKITNNTTRIGNIEAKLDGAIENITAEVSASANAVAAEAAKTAVDGAVVVGYYSGNGAEERTIELGFKPRYVHLTCEGNGTQEQYNNSETIPNTHSDTGTENLHSIYGGVFTPDCPLKHTSSAYPEQNITYAEIVDNGFKVYYKHTVSNINGEKAARTNRSGYKYIYLAIR